jgi:RHS repeat-associated protein
MEVVLLPTGQAMKRQGHNERQQGKLNGLSDYNTDWETDLCLLGFRYYDALAGRFLTRDSIGFMGGINLYEYVGNCPLGRHDSRGLTSIAIPIGGGDLPAPDEGAPWPNQPGSLSILGCTAASVMTALQIAIQALNNGGSFPPGFVSACKVMMACLNGMLCRNVLLDILRFSGIDGLLLGCIIGAACALLGQFLNWLCTQADPCSQGKPPFPLCQTLVNAIAGCLSGAIPGIGAWPTIGRGAAKGLIGLLGLQCPDG